jgi:L-ascorbate metabolism protein UlaG (beta-lactamase superfamily)
MSERAAERVARSPQWRDGRFRNAVPVRENMLHALRDLVTASAERAPKHPLPIVRDGADRLGRLPASGLRATWFGHSSLLVEIDGVRLLVDPMWGERASPVARVGPRRWYAPPIALDALPPIDAVLISHDHYDHLDRSTIAAMAHWPTRFAVPLGVGAHLARWGVARARITELDWWERADVGGVEVVATPARHASGRALHDRDRTLWAGFALRGPRHRAFYSGDSGVMDDVFDEIGARLGPFDLTMVQIGAYGDAWPDWHLGPEDAVRVHQAVGGRVLLPVHWGLFTLAYHAWSEPIERAVVAAVKARVTIATPRPGESVEPVQVSTHDAWWRGGADDREEAMTAGDSR